MLPKFMLLILAIPNGAIIIEMMIISKTIPSLRWFFIAKCVMSP